MSERSTLEPNTEATTGNDDFGETLSMYARYGAESLLRNYFSADGGERLLHLRRQMIARAVCGKFDFVFDLGPLLATQPSDDRTSVPTLHPLTRKTLEDPARFRQLSEYLCTELLGARNDSLTVTLLNTKPNCRENNAVAVKFEWKPLFDDSNRKRSAYDRPKQSLNGGRDTILAQSSGPASKADCYKIDHIESIGSNFRSSSDVGSSDAKPTPNEDFYDVIAVRQSLATRAQQRRESDSKTLASSKSVAYF